MNLEAIVYVFTTCLTTIKPVFLLNAVFLPFQTKLLLVDNLQREFAFHGASSYAFSSTPAALYAFHAFYNSSIPKRL